MISSCEIYILQNNSEKIKNQKFNKNTWMIAAGQKLLWRYWEGDYVVFGSLSGETHTLDIASGKSLERIMSGPSTREDIRSEIANLLEVENDAELANAVDQILLHLEDAGLIEPES